MNYDGDIVFEDDDDESWSALTEDISHATHGTPFSPVVFQPRLRDVDPKLGASAPYEDEFERGETQNRIKNEDAIILAQSRQSQNRLVEVVGLRGPALSIQSPENFERSRKSHYSSIGFGVDNRSRAPGEAPRNSTNMGYLPSRHFQHFVDTKSSSLRPLSHQRDQEHQLNSRANVYDLQSPSNESQNTLSTIRSNHTITSTRSRRSVVSQHSSTSISILHGEVINLEGNAIFAKDAATRLRHIDEDQNSQQESHLSGMEIGGRGDSTFNMKGRQSGGHSFVSSNGFASIQQEKYQGDGSDPVFTFGNASEHILNAQRRAGELGKGAKKGVVKMKGHASSVAKRIISKYYRPPLSPRSRELKDLEYLKQSHKEKFKHLKIANGNDMDENKSFLSNLDEDTDENFFDFIIVLTPQASYEYWANLLDFREEYLGLDTSDVWGRELDSPGGVSTNTTDSRASGGQSLPENSKEDVYNRSPQSSEDNDSHVADLSTPLTGLLRRKSIRTPSLLKTPSRRASRQPSQNFDSHQKSRFSQYSRSVLRSPFEGTPLRKGVGRLSMFERAIRSPTLTSSRSRTFSQLSCYSQSNHTSQSESMKETTSETPMTNLSRLPISTARRRFGNPTVPPTGQTMKSLNNVFSPPVRSLKRKAGSEATQIPLNDSVRSNRLGNQQKTINGKKSLTVDVKKGMLGDEENDNPNVVQTVEDMPNSVIPRGFRVRSSGEVMKFLSALQEGIVLRRHCPNKEAKFCKLSSDDGGDTIKHQIIGSEEAMAALNSQRVRYNRNFDESTSPTSLRAACAPWSCQVGSFDNSSAHKFIPDHVASQKYREKVNREHGMFKRLIDVAVNEVYSGGFDLKDIVALHPATKVDRRSPGFEKDELGTASLRRSLSSYDNEFSFSLITSVGQSFIKSTSENLAATWKEGEGSDHLFKTFDFEAATEGEFWLVFRGLLLLYRDPMNKNLNSNGITGIGGGEPKDVGGEAPTGENRLQQDMYVEPSMVGRLEKLVVKMRKLNDDYIRGAVMPGAKPPPSDYFLGFKSPGTQIWSRLRWAGLETQRVFSADPRKVMIKIRCPEDRLTDLAEVLRLKMKTKDGSYAPFHEDAAHIFKSHDDHLDIPNIYRSGMASLLRSKDRQTIIDFIIGSRIRDSGAELAQTSPVGKMIEAKVPLHMPRKLDSLYNAWVLYWKREHWTGIEISQSPVSHQSSIEEGNHPRKDQYDNEKTLKDHRPIPNFLTRFFVEAFNQPLDAIEDYFGEQVTFYFAWMQHCSIHLLFLAFFGMVVTFCQVITDNYDHWLRPWFALTVMLWTFVVLVNWKKRSNSLAYRWGSMDYKEVETNRPEFFGKYMRDPITDEWVIKYPRWKRWLKYMISFPISIFFTGLALFLILIVHANRDMQMAHYVANRNNFTSGFGTNSTSEYEFIFTWRNIGKQQLVGNMEVTKEQLLDPTYWIIMATLPCMLGLCIPILNIILMNVSMMLNDFENYRTDAEYRTHLIIKVFGFRFISQFGTVYYYAFMSAAIYTKEGFENGMIRMGTSLMIYTTVAHWWNIFLQVYVFMGIRNIRHSFYHKRLRKELKNIELLEEEYNTNERCDAEVREISLLNKRILLDQAQDELWMEVMCPPHDSFPEYITAVVQFSFVACFSFVLPCVPFLVLINYLLSMRFDAYKLCKVRRRPLAKRTGGIGVWEHLLHIVAVIAVLTNCWLVAFFHSGTKEILEALGPTATVFLVVAWEHLMLLIKYLMGNTISALPKSIRDEIKEKQHETENKRYENMRLKTEQTRRLKREKSISGSFRLLSMTPDSMSRAGSIQTRRESKNFDVADSQNSHMTTPGKGGHLQTIESFEEPIVDNSIASSRPGEQCDSMPSARSIIEDVVGGFTIPYSSTPETSGRLQTSESFEESRDASPIANSKPIEPYSVSVPHKGLVSNEIYNEHDSYPLEGSFDKGSGEIFDSVSTPQQTKIEHYGTPYGNKPGELLDC